MDKNRAISNLAAILNWMLMGSAITGGVWLAASRNPVVGALIVGFWVPFGVARAIQLYRWKL